MRFMVQVIVMVSMVAVSAMTAAAEVLYIGDGQHRMLTSTGSDTSYQVTLEIGMPNTTGMNLNEITLSPDLSIRSNITGDSALAFGNIAAGEGKALLWTVETSIPGEAWDKSSPLTFRGQAVGVNGGIIDLVFTSQWAFSE